jgi:hypothetical protein
MKYNNIVLVPLCTVQNFVDTADRVSETKGILIGSSSLYVCKTSLLKNIAPLRISQEFERSIQTIGTKKVFPLPVIIDNELVHDINSVDWSVLRNVNLVSRFLDQLKPQMFTDVAMKMYENYAFDCAINTILNGWVSLLTDEQPQSTVACVVYLPLIVFDNV